MVCLDARVARLGLATLAHTAAAISTAADLIRRIGCVYLRAMPATEGG